MEGQPAEESVPAQESLDDTAHIMPQQEQQNKTPQEQLPDKSKRKKSHTLLARAWIVRACFTLVFAWNVICAVSFVIDPASYAGGFQLEGVSGEAAVRGLGIAFLMWNATYPVFIVRPKQHTSLGAIIIVQQIIGLAGELYILFGLPAGYDALAASILRFVVFDAVGLVIMTASHLSLLIAKHQDKKNRSKS